MWREDDDQQSPVVRYKPLIDGCSTTERVVDLLEEVHAESREELQLRKSAWVASFVHLLRNIVFSKLDQLTAQFLARYDEFEDRETRVMNVAHNTPDIAFGLWVSACNNQQRPHQAILAASPTHLRPRLFVVSSVRLL